MNSQYPNAIHYLAIQAYAPIESIELIAYLWDRPVTQVLADIDKARKGEAIHA